MKHTNYLDPLGGGLVAAGLTLAGLVALPRIILALADKFPMVRRIVEANAGEITSDQLERELAAQAAAGSIEAQTALTALQEQRFSEPHYSELDPIVDGYGDVDKMKRRLRASKTEAGKLAYRLVCRGEYGQARSILRNQK